MLIVVSYDVVNDRRRAKVHKMLKNFGTRVQYSVFECQLDAKELKRLQKRLRPLIDLKEDSVRFYQLCEVCLPKAADRPSAGYRPRRAVGLAAPG